MQSHSYPPQPNYTMIMEQNYQDYRPHPYIPSPTWEMYSNHASEPWGHYDPCHAEESAALYPSPALSRASISREPSLLNLGTFAPAMSPHSTLPQTPPIESPPLIEEDEVLSISTSFYMGAHGIEHDVIFSSADDVLFYVHSQMITTSAPHAFANFLAQGMQTPGVPVKVPESALTLNIILHTLYGTSCAQNSPLLEDLVQAVDTMPEYGIDPHTLILPQTPTYTVLLSFAPLQPITVYALAGRHELSELAEKTSSHLLAYPLFNIDDELAKSIGPVYLRRLFMLHWNRLAHLKNFVLQPPPHHAPTKHCTAEDQNKLTRAWALAAAYLVWDAKPDLSTHMINGAFESIMKNVTCKNCKEVSNARIRQVLTQWAFIKCTI